MAIAYLLLMLFQSRSNRLSKRRRDQRKNAALPKELEGSPSTIMPFIAPLLHPRGEPSSRTPSASSVPGPSRGDFERPTGDNDHKQRSLLLPFFTMVSLYIAQPSLTCVNPRFGQLLALGSVFLLPFQSSKVWTEDSTSMLQTFQAPCLSNQSLTPPPAELPLVTDLTTIPRSSMASGLSLQIKSLPPPPTPRSGWRAFLPVRNTPSIISHPEFALDSNLTYPQNWNIAIDLGQGFSRIEAAFVHQPDFNSVEQRAHSAWPRVLSIWAIIEGQLNEDIYANYTSQPVRHTATESPSLDSLARAFYPPPFLPANMTAFKLHAFKLHAFKYMVGGPPRQVFDLPARISSLGITARTLVFQVHNNWGDPYITEVFSLVVYGSKA